MVPAYCHNKLFRQFVRCVAALPFIPVNLLERSLDELRELAFDKDNDQHEQMEQFKLTFCDYIEETWIRLDLDFRSACYNNELLKG